MEEFANMALQLRAARNKTEHELDGSSGQAAALVKQRLDVINQAIGLLQRLVLMTEPPPEPTPAAPGRQ